MPNLFYFEMDECDLSELIGKTLVSIEKKETEDELLFTTSDGQQYVMWHSQDCCESVGIESIVGDLADLIGEPILVAEASTNSENNPEDASPKTTEYQESFTWTFYKLATRKGYVDIRWYGESNGYYSESVDFHRLPSKAG